jgi:hypothetical protein
MTDWIARYEEGCVTAGGAVMLLTDRLHRDHPWPSPEDALRGWLSRADLQGPDVHRYGNGLEQVDDVRGRPDFRAVDVVSIWRRVTFYRVNELPVLAW